MESITAPPGDNSIYRMAEMAALGSNRVGQKMIKKYCNKCMENKAVGEFYKNRTRLDGLSDWCKKCSNESCREYRQKSRTRINEIAREWKSNNPGKTKIIKNRYNRKNTEKIKIYNKKYREENKEKIKIMKREDQVKNKGDYNFRARKWRRNNPEKMIELGKKRRKKRYSIPRNKLNHQVAGRIRFSLNGNKNGRSWEKITGYSLQDLMNHLEELFKPGMAWENYGKWHIDHIIPVSLWKFKSFDDREFKQCWALANLQPLWAEENISKGVKIEWDRK